jgi:hypothetical protein
VTFDFWLEVEAFDDAEEICDAARDAVVRLAGGASVRGGESQALLESELVAIDQAAIDAMAAKDLGPGISGSVFRLAAPRLEDPAP